MDGRTATDSNRGTSSSCEVRLSCTTPRRLIGGNKRKGDTSVLPLHYRRFRVRLDSNQDRLIHNEKYASPAPRRRLWWRLSRFPSQPPSGQWDSNPRSPGPEPGALTRLSYAPRRMVGLAGFEPAASCTPSKRAKPGCATVRNNGGTVRICTGTGWATTNRAHCYTTAP
jgi:hypothetical protein